MYWENNFIPFVEFFIGKRDCIHTWLFLHHVDALIFAGWFVRTVNSPNKRISMVNLLLVFLNYLVGKFSSAPHLMRIRMWLVTRHHRLFSQITRVSFGLVQSARRWWFCDQKSNHFSTAISNVYLVILFCVLTRLKDTFSTNWYVFCILMMMPWLLRKNKKPQMIYDYMTSYFAVCKVTWKMWHISGLSNFPFGCLLLEFRIKLWMCVAHSTSQQWMAWIYSLSWLAAWTNGCFRQTSIRISVISDFILCTIRW